MTVVIPVHEREDLVLETLDSVAAQAYRPLEVVVVDDGSTDRSADRAEEWGKRRGEKDRLSLVVLRQVNAGAAESRNRGTLASTGEFLQFLDSDDLLDPKKISLQVAALLRVPTVDYAYGPVHELERRDRVIYCQTGMDNRRMLRKQITAPAMQTAAPLFRRATLERIGRWNQALTPMDDWEYYARLPARGLQGVHVAESRVYLRMDVADRLSWKGEPERLGQYVVGRVGLLRSIRTEADLHLRTDRVMRRSMAWQFLAVASRAVLRGWKGNDGELFREAASVAPPLLSFWIRGVLLPLRRTLGAGAAALLVMGLHRAYWAFRGLQIRVGLAGGGTWEG